VGSRVAADLVRPSSAPRLSSQPQSAPPPKNFMCGKPQQGPVAWREQPLLKLAEDQQQLTPRRSKSKPAVPTRTVPARPRTAATDFVKRNALEAKLAPQRALLPVEPSTTELKSKSHGRLPAYLLDRKLELASAAAAKEEAGRPRNCPEGHHVLDDEERLRVLGVVRESKANVNAQLDAFPLVVDTPGQLRKHEELTRELAELEAADKAFSRNRVIVADADGMPLPPTDFDDLSRAAL